MLTPQTPDALRTRLQILQVEHRDLDEAIRALAARPGHDQLSLQRLKKRKLQLKDRIEALERLLAPDEPA